MDTYNRLGHGQGDRLHQIEWNRYVFWCSGGGIDLSLFDGKCRTTVTRYEAVLGFVMGVESVLNRMTSIDDGQIEPGLQRANEKLGPFSVT